MNVRKNFPDHLPDSSSTAVSMEEEEIIIDREDFIIEDSGVVIGFVDGSNSINQPTISFI